MKAIKGFNPDLTCRGYQFVEGQTHEEPKAELCRTGFHAVTYPLDVFGYYPPASSVYHEVEVDDDAKTRPGEDSKVASKRIRIGARISIAGLVKLAVEYTWGRATLEEGGRATGDQGAASATGYQGAASATGNQGAASATGDQGAASATGYQGAASATGPDSVAMAAGWHGRAKGALGCGLMLAERDDYNHLIGVKAVMVDGKRIKPDTWYGLVGGKVVRVDTDGAPIATTKAVAK